MPDRVRIYHPETGEPFDLPEAKASELRLNHGWLAQPLDPNAEAAVKSDGTGTSDREVDLTEDWRGIDVHVDIDIPLGTERPGDDSE